MLVVGGRLGWGKWSVEMMARHHYSILGNILIECDLRRCNSDPTNSQLHFRKTPLCSLESVGSHNQVFRNGRWMIYCKHCKYICCSFMLVRALFGPFLQTGGVCLYCFHNYSLNLIYIWVYQLWMFYCMPIWVRLWWYEPMLKTLPYVHFFSFLLSGYRNWSTILPTHQLC